MNTTSTTAVPTEAPTQSASALGAFVPFLLVMVLFYFLMIKPQQKREAKRKALIDSIKKGDRIVTMSGIIGIVHKIVNADEVSLEIAEGVRIRILKSAISGMLDRNSGKQEESEDSVNNVDNVEKGVEKDDSPKKKGKAKAVSDRKKTK